MQIHLFCAKSVGFVIPTSVAVTIALAGNLGLISPPSSAALVHVLTWKIKCDFLLIRRKTDIGCMSCTGSDMYRSAYALVKIQEEFGWGSDELCRV